MIVCYNLYLAIFQIYARRTLLDGGEFPYQAAGVNVGTRTGGFEIRQGLVRRGVWWKRCAVIIEYGGGWE